MEENDDSQYREFKKVEIPPKEMIAKIRGEFQWNPSKLIYKPKANRSLTPNFEQRYQK